MEIANFTNEYKGKKYYFCVPGCKKKFDRYPAGFAYVFLFFFKKP
ncbi:MAG: YHS domain-containing protein [Methanomicrobiales archaeon]